MTERESCLCFLCCVCSIFSNHSPTEVLAAQGDRICLRCNFAEQKSAALIKLVTACLHKKGMSPRFHFPETMMTTLWSTSNALRLHSWFIWLAFETSFWSLWDHCGSGLARRGSQSRKPECSCEPPWWTHYVRIQSIETIIDMSRGNAAEKIPERSNCVRSLYKCSMKTVVCVALSGVRCRWSISNSPGFPSGCIMTEAGDWLLWSSDWTLNKQCCVGPRVIQWLSEDVIRGASKQILETKTFDYLWLCHRWSFSSMVFSWQ